MATGGGCTLTGLLVFRLPYKLFFCGWARVDDRNQSRLTRSTGMRKRFGEMKVVREKLRPRDSQIYDRPFYLVMV